MSNIALNNEDGILLSGIEQGDLTSLGMMYDKYSTILYGIIIRIVKNETLAENVLTKVFLNVKNQSVSVSNSSSIFCFLFKYCRQISFDALKEQQLKNLPQHNGVYGISTTAFELLYYKGLNYNEAAIILNKTVEEVKVEVRGAIDNLKMKNKK